MWSKSHSHTPPSSGTHLWMRQGQEGVWVWGQADVVRCCLKHKQNRSVHIHRLQGRKRSRNLSAQRIKKRPVRWKGWEVCRQVVIRDQGQMSSAPCCFTDLGLLLSRNCPSQHQDSWDGTQQLQKSQCRSPVRNYCVCLRWVNRTSRTPQSRKTK